MLAWLWSEQGRREEARGAIERLGDLRLLPVDGSWLLVMTMVADALATLVDTERSDTVYDLLGPFADRVVPIGMGVASWGSVHRPLGRLAAVLGHRDAAVGHLRAAVRAEEAMGARPWAVAARLDLVDVLLAGPAEHRHEADEELRVAVATAATIAMPAMVDRAGRLRDRLGPTAAGSPARAAITVLGGFSVVAAGSGEPARWVSRKARDLLKILVARRGAVDRRALMELLWPDEDPGLLTNRLSVLISTVRRTLDPDRDHPADRYVVTGTHGVRLDLDHLDLDVERFLRSASVGLALWREGRRREALARLRDAEASYRGDAFAEDLYEGWAWPLRDEAASAFAAVARALAEGALDGGDTALARRCYLRLVELDPYDEASHRDLVSLLVATGAHGDARAAQRRYADLMAEVGIVAAPTPS